MSKKGFLVLIILGVFLITGCGQVMNNTSDDNSTSMFSSIGEKMKECAPNISSSEFDTWSSWSITSNYGLLKKHFNKNSGLECIFSGADNLDLMLSSFSDALESADENGNLNVTVNHTDSSGNAIALIVYGKYSNFSGSVNLPTLLGGDSISSTTLQKKVTMDIYSAGTKIMEIELYYGINSNIQTIVYQNNNIAEQSKSIAYGILDNNSKTIIYKEAFAYNEAQPANGTPHGSGDKNFRCYLQFEGNYFDKTSKFSLKTNVSNGWAVIGGGSVANNDSKYAIRGTYNGDSTTYINDAVNLTGNIGHYVILTRNDIYSGATPSGGWPKSASLLSSETEDSKKYIDTNDINCLGWTNYFPVTSSDVTFQ